MVFHPAGDAFEDARRDALLDELHAPGVTNLIAEIAPESGAEGGGEHEEDEVGVLGGEQNDHDVGDAGDGQRHERGVDDGDEEDADQSEAEDEVHELALMVGRGEPHGGGVEWQQRRGVGGHHGRRDARGGPEVAQR